MIEFKTGDILRPTRKHSSTRSTASASWGAASRCSSRTPSRRTSRPTKACAHEDVQPGRMFVYETGQLTNPRFIINFPTKRHWRGKSRIEDIESGLRRWSRRFASARIRSIAIPPLGSGLGGLDWDEVRPRIEAALARAADDLQVHRLRAQWRAGTKRCVRSRRSRR